MKYLHIVFLHHMNDYQFGIQKLTISFSNQKRERRTRPQSTDLLVMSLRTTRTKAKKRSLTNSRQVQVQIQEVQTIRIHYQQVVNNVVFVKSDVWYYHVPDMRIKI
jgi:hypothetical protein